MFDVNKAIMRCLTKNLAMFGLGLYIYAGEDIPETEREAEKANILKGMTDELKELYKKAGGKDFDKWVESVGGMTAENYPKMKTTLVKQINDKAEKESK